MAVVINFSEAFIIGVHSLVVVSQAKSPVNLETIAEGGNVMKNHASKVLQTLVKKGIMTSYKGPSGGFVLSKSTYDINMLDLYEMIEGPIAVEECPRSKHVCPFGNCLMGGIVARLSVEVRDFLAAHSLGSLLEGRLFPVCH